MSDVPKLIIVGRPNVGKSTLFNRLFGRRRALVHDLPGVTRDRLEEETKWMVQGEYFPIRLVDTGGVGGDRFAEEIEQQVKIALAEAQIVVALFDAQAGLIPADRDLVRKLGRAGVGKKGGIPLIAVVNKVDAESHEEAISDFYELGIEPTITISAEHGRGTEDLKEEVVRLLKETGIEPAITEEDDEQENESETEDGTQTVAVAATTMETETDSETETEYANQPIKLAIIGRPNVGKSTLTNALLGEKRMIVSPIAGTTVDSVDTPTELDGKPFILIDTAGIRRKSKTEKGIEVLSVVQTRKAIERADVAILLLDGETGITDQDEKIGGLIEEAGCGVILVLNKWDTQERNQEFTKEHAAERIRKQMAYLKYAPIVFTSALKGRGLKGLGELATEIIHQRRLKLTTPEFTKWVRAEVPIHNPKGAKFFLCHQSGRNPPTFVCHVNDPERVHFSLRRHLVNALRERWGYMGNPVRMLFVKGKNRASL